MNNQEENKRTYLQDQQVCRSWLKILESLRQENALLLNRLAEALRDADNPRFLEQAEIFQTKIISKEESLVLLRHEVMEQLDWLDIVPQPTKEAPHEFAVLEKDVNKMQVEFEKMQYTFNLFLKN
ncbi:hypothetical protein [Chitinophaga solisilvae]|uniref:Uncharacterized protein n=1 Tax=Chitinophaga solisilvae TaxID=1233460 RepID=A0A3S1JIU8_9BACT|nr:hypothetical protein [Chitinophaga solisilvae]NSL90711.1 hypothetical protein [Chitinophaga solisilvae]